VGRVNQASKSCVVHWSMELASWETVFDSPAAAAGVLPRHVHTLSAPAVSLDTRTPASTACSFTPWVHLHGVMLSKWWLESNPQWQQLVKQWPTPLGGSAGGILCQFCDAQLPQSTLLSAAAALVACAAIQGQSLGHLIG
jgi:hypothetical protein